MSIIDMLERQGPCTGHELLAQVDLEVLALWRLCLVEPRIHTRIAGRRYLRLDKNIEGYARLSPSIRREFLTYTVIGLTHQTDAIAARCSELERDFLSISTYKRGLAQQIMRAVIELSPNCERLKEHLCCVIAGDVTFGMAHSVERPESSTGRLVRGSDLDVVLISDGKLTTDEICALDKNIYERKWTMLALPQYREELDYVIKDLDRVMSQLKFDTLRRMIACKIMHEGELLYGSQTLFAHIVGLLQEYSIPEKLQELEERAVRERETAERLLLERAEQDRGLYWHHLFFTSDEKEEIC